MPSADDDEYTHDDGQPLSIVPLPVQAGIAAFFTVCVAVVVLLGCCLTRPSLPLHGALNRVFFREDDRKGWCCAAGRRRRKEGKVVVVTRALLETRSPVLGGCVAFVFCASRWLVGPARGDAVAGLRQAYLLVWKLVAEKFREPVGVACSVGFPTVVAVLTWLLYAVFNAKRSSGAIEQYLTVLAFVYSVQSVAAAVAFEKSARLRLSLRQMGVRDGSWYAAVYAVEAAFVAASVALVVASIAATARLYRNAGAGFNAGVSGSAWWALFNLFWAYGAAAVSMALVLAALVASAPTASMASFALVIVSIVAFIVLRVTSPAALKNYLHLWLGVPPIALDLAVAGFSSTFARYPLDVRVDVATVTTALWIDVVAYAALAYYLERTLPSEFGTRDRWDFPIRWALGRCAAAPGGALSMMESRIIKLRHQRRGSRASSSLSSSSSSSSSVVDDDEIQMPLRDVEAFLSPLLGQEEKDGGTAHDATPTVSVRSLRKVFGGTHVALDAVSLDLYENEIVTLLGHNGAGKTTLLNILTGLLEADPAKKKAPGDQDYFNGDIDAGGGATIYGRALGEVDLGVLGVCPQHDVLWPRLTVREHVALCAALKTAAVDPLNAGGDALLKTFNLDKRHAHLGQELSGGMRRKLSTACALSGGSKFVILDEPTTGLDPLARRELWDLLASLKSGRTMLLTTHYMDEADALGDRVAILSRGRVVADAAPDDLKRDLGAGYKLTCELKPPRRRDAARGRMAALGEAVVAAVPGARPWRGPPTSKGSEHDDSSSRPPPSCEDVTRRAEYALPVAESERFGVLLRSLEADARAGGALGVETYGISQCDLEDVFERVGDSPSHDDIDDSDVDVGGRDDQGTSRRENGIVVVSKPPEEDEDDDDVEVADDPGMIIGGEEEASSTTMTTTTTTTTTPRRVFSSSASGDGLLVRLGRRWCRCLPPWSVVAALARKRLICAQRDAKTVALVIFPLGCVVAAFSLNARDDFGPRGRFAANFTTGLLVMLAFVPVAGFFAMEVASERASKLRDVLTVAGCSSEAYLAGTFLGDLALLIGCLLAIGLVSTVAGLATAAYQEKVEFRFPRDVAALPDAVLRKGLETYAHAHPEAGFPADDVWIPRQYHPWIDAVTDDYVRTVVEPAFNVTDDGWRTMDTSETDDEMRRWARHWPVCWFFPWLFGVELLAFSYAASFMADGPRQAVVLVPMLVLALLFLPVTLLSLVNVTFGDQGLGAFTISKDAFTGVLLWGTVLTSPHGALLMALAHASTNIDRFASGFPPFAATCLIATIEALLYAYACYAVDRRPSTLKLKRVELLDDDGDASLFEGDDVDVAAERSAAREAFDARRFSPLHVKGLRKVYRKPGARPVVAVAGLHLRVEADEIFGLLGANGAGKTTAIAMLMRSTYPSAGDAAIAGHSILDDFQNAMRNLGVVTQSDTLYDRLTSREHCKLFAALRMRTSSLKDTEKTVAAVLRAMDLDLSVTQGKRSAQLSGGQKRKLCTAVALIGGPKVVLLDEPSAGLDPVSRRRLWAVLRRTMGRRSVVLTSHSMEESEALCTRVGIMQLGRLKALGTPQHLKAKFVSEYTLRIFPSFPNNNSKNNNNNKGRVDEDATRTIDRLAAGPRLRGRRLVPKVPTTRGVLEYALDAASVNVADIFDTLEEEKRSTTAGSPIESYALVQPTLEQVFVKVVTATTTTRTTNANGDAFGTTSHPSADEENNAEEDDAALLVESARCCGLDRRAHRFVATAGGILALIIVLTLSGLIGPPPSYDDDRRAYDDDARTVGCHREMGRAPPCSTAAITLDGIPFFLALVVAVLGCCGCCCCIAKLPTTSAAN